MSRSGCPDCTPPDRWGRLIAYSRREALYDPNTIEYMPRITDLVPRSGITCLLILAVGVAVIAGLEILYLQMPLWASYTSDGRIAAFDLDGEGSLAVWFSSTCLLAAAIFSWLIYAVRRWRLDDPDAYHRIWAWAALCWLVMSLDETASLHEGFKELATLATGTRISGDGSLWWAIPYAMILIPLGVRLLAELRESWIALGTFLLAGACYALAVATQLQWILPESGARGVALEEGAELLGDLLLLWSLLMFARHVIIRAERAATLPQYAVSSSYLSNVCPVAQAGVLHRVDRPHGPVVKPPANWRPGRQPIVRPFVKRSLMDLRNSPLLRFLGRLLSELAPPRSHRQVPPEPITPPEIRTEHVRMQTNTTGLATCQQSEQYHATSQPTVAQSGASGSTASTTAATSQSTDNPWPTAAERYARMSKAERKALRKKLMEMRARQQQRQG